MSNVNPPFIFAPNSAGLPVGPAADTFLLSGENCPGKCELTSCAATQAWDIREANGFNWATVVPKGEKLSEPIFSIEIWEGGQYAAWLVYAGKYFSRPAPASPGTVKSKAFAFSHPLASAVPFGVNAVLVQEVSYKGGGEGGSLLFEVKLLEWKKPLPTSPRPDQQTPPTDNGPPTATDALGQHQNEVSADLNGALEEYSSIPEWGAK